jgi:hypothetical protein
MCKARSGFARVERRQHAMFTKVRKASRSVLMPESFAAFASPPPA